MKKQDWLKYTGNMSQISGITKMQYTEGKAKGMGVWNVQNGNGLSFDLLPDKCLDIARLSYKGVNIGWLAKNGYASGVYGYPVLNEFDRYFGGGMLWTCGLKNTGGDHIDENGSFQHLHGRLGLTPCEQAWGKAEWEGDDYVITAGGDARDSILAGHDLLFHRTIRTSLNSSEIEITDVIENCEPEGTDYLSLYHFNFGYPFVSPDMKYVLPDEVKEIIPRTPAAEGGMADRLKLEEPIDGYEEQCFFHHLASVDGWSSFRLENPALGIAVTLSYEAENLPILTQWKSVRSGEYVLGMEPGNSYLRGMQEEKKEGNVGYIGGYETKTMRLKLAFSSL